MHFLLHAYDHTDAEALDRRMAVRPNHFESARAMKARGELVFGGALLSPEGKMIGSAMLVDFPDETALRDWLTTEPYVVNRVWDKIDVKPFLLADL